MPPRTSYSSLLIAILLGALMTGCGGDDDETATSGAGASGTAGASGSSGTAGASGSGASAGASGTSGSGGSMSQQDVDAACEAFANAACATFTTCASLLITKDPDCAAHGKTNCLARFEKNPAWTVATQKSCTTAFQAGGCDAIYHLPDVCYGPPGPKADGDPCLLTTECGEDMTCALQTGHTSACGLCKTRAHENDACGDGTPCDVGLRCGDTCYKPGQQGQPCSATKVCDAPLACGPGGTCETAKSKGDPCDSSADTCDRAQGFFCGPKTHTCDEFLLASAAGASCGYDTQSGAYTLCAGALHCSGQNFATDLCSPDVAEGQNCQIDNTGADPCAAGLYCVGTCLDAQATFCN